jgi:hypothetical protein
VNARITIARLAGLTVVLAALTSGTATASETSRGLKADGLRLQKMAQAYGKVPSGPTPLGLKADGLRLQKMAQAYQRLESRPAASYYTPQALKASALRWQAMARMYDGQRSASGSTAASSQRGFDWAAAFIGAASSLGFVACCLALLIGTRRVRRQRLVQT